MTVEAWEKLLGRTESEFTREARTSKVLKCKSRSGAGPSPIRKGVVFHDNPVNPKSSSAPFFRHIVNVWPQKPMRFTASTEIGAVPPSGATTVISSRIVPGGEETAATLNA